METASKSATSNRRLLFGVVAMVTAILVALLIYSGVAKPYPDMKTALILCLGVAAFGLIQLIISLLSPVQK